MDVCPAVAATRDGDLSALVRMRGLTELLKNRNSVFRKLFGRKEPTAEALRRFGTSVFRCSLCGACQEVCPVGLPLKDLWLTLREELVRTGNAPEKIGMIKENLAGSRNVFDEDNAERADWVEDMAGTWAARAAAAGDVGLLGGYEAEWNDFYGEALARAASRRRLLEAHPGPLADILKHCWIGFREYYHGTV